MSEIPDDLDVSLRDFEPPLSPELLHRSRGPSEAPMTETDEEDEAREHHLLDSEIASEGGYSPPAWRRLGNGARSSGFWNGPADGLGLSPRPFRSMSRELSPGIKDEDDYYEGDEDGILERAIRTRLPKGSQSPERTRHSTPERTLEDDTLKLKVDPRSPSIDPSPEPVSDNCK